MPSKQNPSFSGKPADYLANERTFLAWVRTSIALMGFGIVIVKFSLFLREISFALGEEAVIPGRSYSENAGLILLSLGAVLTVLAYFRYVNIKRKLDQDEYYPTGWLSALVTLCIVASCILLAWYL